MKIKILVKRITFPSCLSTIFKKESEHNLEMFLLMWTKNVTPRNRTQIKVECVANVV